MWSYVHVQNSSKLAERRQQIHILVYDACDVVCDQTIVWKFPERQNRRAESIDKRNRGIGREVVFVALGERAQLFTRGVEYGTGALVLSVVGI